LAPASPSPGKPISAASSPGCCCPRHWTPWRGGVRGGRNIRACRKGFCWIRGSAAVNVRGIEQARLTGVHQPNLAIRAFNLAVETAFAPRVAGRSVPRLPHDKDDGVLVAVGAHFHQLL